MLIIFANFGLWLHRMGSDIVALPVRLIIGLVFINQGIANFSVKGGSNSAEVMQSAAGEGADPITAAAPVIVNLADYGFPEAATISLSVLLIIAGALAITGLFCRLVGAGMTVLIVTNLFAGFTLEGFFTNYTQYIEVIQDRLLLAVGSLVLFFLGAGIFALDRLIFRSISKAFDGDDDEKRDHDRDR